MDFVSAGEGPTLLFLPGSFSTHAAWRAVQRQLPPIFRQVSTSLLGYGRTAETRSLGDADMRHEIALVAAVVRRAGGPVHLVGHSFGALVALATALSGTVDVAGLALFEANPLHPLIERGHEDLYRQALQMSQAFESAVQAGDADAAGRVIDYWGGAGTFAAMPPPVQAYCRETAPSNVLDWHTAFGVQVPLAELARLDLPVLLVRGERANAAMCEITASLGISLPRARKAIVAGADHFLISSHAPECAALLTDFLASPG